MEPKKRNTRKRKRVAQQQTTCQCCGIGAGWTKVTKLIELERRGVTHEVDAEMLSCNQCKETTLGGGQFDILKRKLEQKHRDFIAKICIQKREILGMNQLELAEFLQLGSSTIKRAELGSTNLSVINESSLLEKIRDAEFVKFGLDDNVQTSPRGWADGGSNVVGMWNAVTASKFGAGAVAAGIVLTATSAISENQELDTNIVHNTA